MREQQADEARDKAGRPAPRPSARDTRGPSEAPLGPLPGGGFAPAAVTALQRAAGNAAVTAAMARDSHEHSPGCGHGAPVQRSAVHDVLRGAGTPLDTGTRTEMEARLGADFSDVRLHTDTVAQRSAAEIGARAYTSGSHVVIGEGGSDKHTLAHELTHVIQQRQGPVAGTDDGGGLRVSDPSDRFEQAAEANARQVMAGPVPQRREDGGGPGPERSAGHGEPAVQRMRMPWQKEGKQEQQGPAPVTLRVGDESITTTRQGAYYHFRTPAGGNAFIHDVAVNNGVVGPELAGHITRYLNGGLVLYRGIPRWHPTWHQVIGEGVIPPLGSGWLPDFDTHNTSFIPFAPREDIARGAAVGTSGMGPGDRAQFVEGYSRQGEHEVGMMVTVRVGPEHDVGFYNGGEIQARGPVDLVSMQVFTMGTDVEEALTGTPGAPPEPLRGTRPATPTEAEKDAYRAEYGGLRK
ncbi:eCIS core domain-containing protein [Streptomyces sp. NPDC003401]